MVPGVLVVQPYSTTYTSIRRSSPSRTCLMDQHWHGFCSLLSLLSRYSYSPPLSIGFITRVKPAHNGGIHEQKCSQRDQRYFLYRSGCRFVGRFSLSVCLHDLHLAQNAGSNFNCRRAHLASSTLLLRA